jgi:uncharacterized protein YjgD (DUF1641 family)
MVSYLDLINQDNDISDKLSISYILSKNCPIMNIKNMSSLCYKYFEKVDKENILDSIEDIYLKISSVEDSIYFNLIDRVNNSI